jgi:hypothetical protein
VSGLVTEVAQNTQGSQGVQSFGNAIDGQLPVHSDPFQFAESLGGVLDVTVSEMDPSFGFPMFSSPAPITNTQTDEANEQTEEFNFDDWLCSGEDHDTDEEPTAIDELSFSDDFLESTQQIL